MICNLLLATFNQKDVTHVIHFVIYYFVTHFLSLGLWGVPKSFGKIKCFDKFDGDFFKMDKKTASYTDPQDRILLEATYEAILDAGE